jgi:hypothetical protein
MDFALQRSGLDKFLSLVLPDGMDLAALLLDLGFDQEQVDFLLAGHLEPVVSQFIDAVQKRLPGSSGKDPSFYLISRRFSLDGEVADPLETIAARLDISPEYARRLSEDALESCRTKTALEHFRKALRFIVIAQLASIAGRPPRERVADKLERLSNLRGATIVARLDYDSKKAEILKKVQDELDALDAEYNPLFETADGNIHDLEVEIKNDVLLFGESIQAGSVHAVFVQGRVSWDNDGMNRYAEAHPEVLPFRRQGQPSVTLRTVEEKK